MTLILSTCPDCNGSGSVPHVPRTLLDGEIRNPNDLDQYKTEDTCWPCRGSGKRPVELYVAEPSKTEPGDGGYGC